VVAACRGLQSYVRKYSLVTVNTHRIKQQLATTETIQCSRKHEVASLVLVRPFSSRAQFEKGYSWQLLQLLMLYTMRSSVRCAVGGGTCATLFTALSNSACTSRDSRVHDVKKLLDIWHGLQWSAVNW